MDKLKIEGIGLIAKAITSIGVLIFVIMVFFDITMGLNDTYESLGVMSLMVGGGALIVSVLIDAIILPSCGD